MSKEDFEKSISVLMGNLIKTIIIFLLACGIFTIAGIFR